MFAAAAEPYMFAEDHGQLADRLAHNSVSVPCKFKLSVSLHGIDKQCKSQGSAVENVVRR